MTEQISLDSEALSDARCLCGRLLARMWLNPAHPESTVQVRCRFCRRFVTFAAGNNGKPTAIEARP